MAKDITDWKCSQARFQGYMRAKMEEHDKKLDKINGTNKEQYNRIGQNEKDIHGMKIKSGILGTIGGVVGGVLAYFLRGR